MFKDICTSMFKCVQMYDGYSFSVRLMLCMNENELLPETMSLHPPLCSDDRVQVKWMNGLE